MPTNELHISACLKLCFEYGILGYPGAMVGFICCVSEAKPKHQRASQSGNPCRILSFPFVWKARWPTSKIFKVVSLLRRFSFCLWVQVFHRRLGSSSTGGITGYLNKKCFGEGRKRFDMRHCGEVYRHIYEVDESVWNRFLVLDDLSLSIQIIYCQSMTLRQLILKFLPYLHFIRWMRCPQHWTLGAGSSVSWPTTGSFQSVDGSPGMQSALQDGCVNIQSVQDL